MNLSECISKRRSIREYKSDKIDSKIIEDILYHGTLSPSGHNRQPWYFVMIESNEIKNQIGDFIISKIGDAGIRTASVIKQAPVLVLVYNSYEVENNNSDMFDLQSVGACMQNICLRACDLGIGSLWIGYVCEVDDEVNKLINSKYKRLMGAIALGYPNQDPNARPRKTLEEVSEWL